MEKIKFWWWTLKWYCQPSTQFIVITKTHRDDNYDSILYSKPTVIGWGPEGDIVEERLFEIPLDEPLPSPEVKGYWVRLPVFEEGEILVVNKHGREIAGLGRKPSKWRVEFETFWTLRAALRRAKRLYNEKN